MSMPDIYDVRLHGVESLIRRCSLYPYYLGICFLAGSLNELKMALHQISPDKQLLERDQGFAYQLWKKVRGGQEGRARGDHLPRLVKLLNESTSASLTSYYQYELDRTRERDGFPAIVGEPQWGFAALDPFSDPTKTKQDGFTAIMQGCPMLVGLAINEVEGRCQLRFGAWKADLTARVTQTLLLLQQTKCGARPYDLNRGGLVDFCQEFPLDSEVQSIFRRVGRAWVVKDPVKAYQWMQSRLEELFPPEHGPVIVPWE